jgi:hypothetical protein
MAEQTWVIHWEGLHTLEEARKKKGKKRGYVLYQLSGLKGRIIIHFNGWLTVTADLNR